jgi:hypothetical protein
MHNPAADAKTAAATAVALEATEESNKLRSLGPTTTDMLDTAAALLHCARHLIRRSLPTLNALNATASKTTSSNTEGNFENVKHLNHLEHLIKLIHQSTELDKYAHELDELKDNMTDIFYILASLDTSLEVVYHRSDLVRCFSCCCCLTFFLCSEFSPIVWLFFCLQVIKEECKHRLVEHTMVEEEEKLEEKQRKRRLSGVGIGLLKEPEEEDESGVDKNVPEQHLIDPPPTNERPLTAEAFVQDMSEEQVLWWTQVLAAEF